MFEIYLSVTGCNNLLLGKRVVKIHLWVQYICTELRKCDSSELLVGSELAAAFAAFVETDLFSTPLEGCLGGYIKGKF